MARKTLHYTVSTEGRDKGKVFVLTEMDATRAEKWAIRVFLAIAKGGIDLPDGVAQSGMAGLAKVGLELLMRISFADAEPLLDEMLSCVTVMPNPATPNVIRPLFDGDIEEVSTLITLRRQILGLHVNFFTDGGQSTSDQAPGRPGKASVSIKTSR